MFSKVLDWNSSSVELSCETNFFLSYYKNSVSAKATHHASRGDYGLHNRPTTQAINEIVKKFEETGVVTNIERPVHYRFASSAENIAIINESIVKDPNASITLRSQELGLSYGTLWRIFHLDLHLHPYKVQPHSN